MEPGERDRFDAALSAATSAWSLDIPADRRELLHRHFDAVLETNRVMNLTRITDPVEAAVRHYADSLVLLELVRERGLTVHTMLDVGSGAGFPAIPVAIMRPDWEVTAIDSTRKKTDFLRRTVEQLSLPNVRVHHVRAEEWRCGNRFDLVVLRAVSPMAEALQAVSHLVAKKGRIVLFKTARVSAGEIESANRVSKLLKLTPASPFDYLLAGENAVFEGRVFLFSLSE